MDQECCVYNMPLDQAAVKMKHGSKAVEGWLYH